MRRSSLRALPLTATGVGSLPFVDAEEALAFVARSAPLVPFWPELPRLAETESAIGAALDGCFRWVEPAEELGSWRVRDLTALEDAARRPLSPLRTPVARTWRRAVRAKHFPRAVAWKLQSIGPLTLASALRWNEAPLDATRRGRDLVLALAARAALRRVHAVRESGLPLLLLLDEPNFAVAPLERERARDLWKRLLPRLRGPEVALGLHVCASLTPRDLRGAGLELLSCAGLRDPRSASSPTTIFGRESGVLLAGVVPTWPATSIAELPPAAELAAACPRGASWRGRLLVTATCGLGLLDARAAAANFECAHAVAEHAAAALEASPHVRQNERSGPRAGELASPGERSVIPARAWVALALDLIGAGAPRSSASPRRFGGPESPRPRSRRIPSDPRDPRSLQLEILRLGLHADRLPAALALVRLLRALPPRFPFRGPLAELRRLPSVRVRRASPPRSGSSATRSSGR
ncbi:MAG: hypothetical protein JNM84_26170 [Planctomycetes bacterium]|nr:hypothetical protein [Planctomycetota bacterium]